MAKDPVFPLYYNDIDRSTKTWTDEEFGAYMRLLMDQWDKGFLPTDYQRLTRIATSLDRTWPMLKVKFVETDGVLKNLNLEVIREKIAKHREKQRENVAKRYQKSTKQSTKSLPLEDENENENENSILKDYESWTSQILDNSDHVFEQMFIKESIPPSDHVGGLVRDHLALLHRYPKMRPADQQSFRYSCIKHVKENINKVNGSKQTTPKLTLKDLNNA